MPVLWERRRDRDDVQSQNLGRVGDPCCFVTRNILRRGRARMRLEDEVKWQDANLEQPLTFMQRRWQIRH